MHIEPRLIDFAEMVIAAEVRKLVRSGTIRRADAEDTRGEMMAILLTVWDMYDPIRGTREAFINKVVGTRLVSFLRAKYAKKRGRQPQALDAASSVAAPIAAEDTENDMHRRFDVEDAIRALPPDQREIANVLLRENVSDAAKELDMARSTLRGACAAIRANFYDRGLEEYL